MAGRSPCHSLPLLVRCFAVSVTPAMIEKVEFFRGDFSNNIHQEMTPD
jgi:hypothetical protein